MSKKQVIKDAKRTIKQVKGQYNEKLKKFKLYRKIAFICLGLSLIAVVAHLIIPGINFSNSDGEFSFIYFILFGIPFLSGMLILVYGPKCPKREIKDAESTLKSIEKLNQSEEQRLEKLKKFKRMKTTRETCIAFLGLYFILLIIVSIIGIDINPNNSQIINVLFFWIPVGVPSVILFVQFLFMKCPTCGRDPFRHCPIVRRFFLDDTCAECGAHLWEPCQTNVSEVTIGNEECMLGEISKEYKDLENVINEFLIDDEQINALDFVAHLRKNENLSVSEERPPFFIDKGDDDDDYITRGQWWVRDKNNIFICEIEIFTTIAGSDWSVCLYGDVGVHGAMMDKSIKKTRKKVWASVETCDNCNPGCNPGTHRTIFGKVFENPCRASGHIFSPKKHILDGLKKIIDCR